MRISSSRLCFPPTRCLLPLETHPTSPSCSCRSSCLKSFCDEERAPHRLCLSRAVLPKVMRGVLLLAQLLFGFSRPALLPPPIYEMHMQDEQGRELLLTGDVSCTSQGTTHSMSRWYSGAVARVLQDVRPTSGVNSSSKGPRSPES